jgi:hypothetical protein
MKGDYSRLTLRPDKHYSAVVSQQGRVRLDADTNKQSAIQRQLVSRNNGSVMPGLVRGETDLQDLRTFLPIPGIRSKIPGTPGERATARQAGEQPLAFRVVSNHVSATCGTSFPQGR